MLFVEKLLFTLRIKLLFEQITNFGFAIFTNSFDLKFQFNKKPFKSLIVK